MSVTRVSALLAPLGFAVLAGCSSAPGAENGGSAAADSTSVPATTDAGSATTATYDVGLTSGVLLGLTSDEVTQIAVDADLAYYAGQELDAKLQYAGAVIRSVPRTGGTVTTLLEDKTPNTAFSAFMIDQDSLFWLRTVTTLDQFGGPQSTVTTLMTMPKAGGTATELLSVPNAAYLSIDADNFYYSTFLNSGATQVFRVSRTTLSSTLLATDEGAIPIAVDGTNLYYATGGVFVLPKNAPAGTTPTTLSGDLLDATDLEVDSANLYVTSGYGFLDVYDLATGARSFVQASADNSKSVGDDAIDNGSIYLRVSGTSTVEVKPESGSPLVGIENTRNGALLVDRGTIFSAYYNGTFTPAGFRAVPMQ